MKIYKAALTLALIAGLCTTVQAASTNKELQKLIKSAEKGDVSAQYQLGTNYEYGYRSEVNLPQAIIWYEKAASGQSGFAAQSLCRIFTEGKTTPADWERAIPFCLQADRLISDTASPSPSNGYMNKVPTHTVLGYAYDEGVGGLEKDPIKARHHLERASVGGDATSVERLVKIYSELPDADRDDAEILKTVHLIRKTGVNAIVSYMAVIYEKGRGVEPDMIEAERLYRIAADKGDPVAKAWLAAHPELTIEEYKQRLVTLATEPYRSFFILHHIPTSTEPPVKLSVMGYLFRDLAKFYPARAMDSDIGGRVGLNCKWSDEGTLTNCIVISETTPGYGFSETSIKMMERPLPVYDSAAWKNYVKGKHLQINSTWSLN